MKLRSLLPVCLLLAACASEDEGEQAFPLEPPAAGEGFQIGMRATAPPFEEIWKCNVFELDTDQAISPVHRVQSLQTGDIHHMDVIILSLAGVDLAPGTYDCAQIYDDYPELMEGGLFLYASQRGEQEIVLPDGVAANIPRGIVAMQEIHYVNTTDQPVDTFSVINAYTMPQADVRQQIWGSAVRDTHLEIPASSEHDEWTRCVMNEDVDVLFMASHTHELGKSVTVRMFDGMNVGEEIYQNTDWHAPQLQNFGNGMHVAAGTGFEFTCNFANPRREDVHWGFTAHDEMCQIGLVYTPGSSTAKCTPVASSDGVLSDGEGDGTIGGMMMPGAPTN